MQLNFLCETFCPILRYVCYPLNGRTGWGRLHLPTGAAGSFGSWGCVIFGCIDVWITSYNWKCWSLKFRNRTFLISWRDLLHGFLGLPCFTPSSPSMKPNRERSNGVGPGRLGDISSFRAHGELLPVSNVGLFIKIRQTHVQNASAWWTIVTLDSFDGSENTNLWLW